ncbi:MAG: hypothetical protein O7A63_09750 [Acidobacteria bacterium]|nr:hypothetical protein [Acidobacteriota bacterium]
MSRSDRLLGGFLLAGVLLCGTACGAASGEAASKDDTGGGNSAIAAQVGDRKITVEEIDEAAMKTNMQAYQSLYTARRAALDRMITDILVEQEAAEQGLAVEKLYEQHLNAANTAVTEEDVKKYYDDNSARLGGKTLELVQAQIRQYLQGQKINAARTAFVDGLKKKAGVTIALEAPRAPVVIAANDPFKGPEDAPITIVEFSDFQ